MRGQHLYKHGGTNTRLHSIWKHMRQRTLNPKCKDYRYYGGRGVKLCDEWLNNFEAFRNWALLNGYRDNLTIDRKDTDGDYTPDNCKWATRQEQSANRRYCYRLTVGGETHNIADWSKITGIPESTIRSRITRLGWLPEVAVLEVARA